MHREMTWNCALPLGLAKAAARCLSLAGALALGITSCFPKMAWAQKGQAGPPNSQSQGTAIQETQPKQKPDIGKVPINTSFFLGPGITKATPTFGSGDTSVMVQGGDLGSVTAVTFGGQQAGFTVLSNTSIRATAPLKGVPGSTVPVSAVSGGNVVPTSATFSYPIGEMDVTGPMPFARGTVGDPDWYNGHGHLISVNPPQNLNFAIPSPTLHVTITFVDDSPAFPKGSYQGDLVGNEATYSVTAQMCSLNGPTSFASEDTKLPCTNHDQNSGTWLNLPAQNVTLSTSGAGQTTWGDIAVPLGVAFDDANTVRTFRLELGMQQRDTNTAEASGYRMASQTSSQFNVIVAPAALIQLNVIPYTILYQPPGDQSTATFSTNTSYGTNFSLGNSTENSNSYSASQSGSDKVDEALSFFYGISLGATSNWDLTTTQTFGTTQGTTSGGSSAAALQIGWSTIADPNLVPGSGDTCASPTDCSQVVHDPNIRSKEPFWLDTFLLLVHPQFAVWILGNNQDRFVMYGAVPVTADAEVIQLDACVHGQKLYGQDQCEISYSDEGLYDGAGNQIYYVGSAQSITLTPTEASNLLQMDPFYVGGQGAALLETRALPVASPSYGGKIGQQPRAVPATYLNTQAQQAGSSTQLVNSSSSSDTIGSNQSAGFTASIGAAGVSDKSDITIGSGESNKYSVSVKTTFADSTATSNQKVTTAQVTLQDFDNTVVGNSSVQCKNCHNPLPNQPKTNIYLDRIFGSFMFQDPDAPSTPAAPQLTQVARSQALVAATAQQEQNRQRYADLPATSACHTAAGILARTHIMTGTNRQFSPDTPMTRAQLATSLTKALNLPGRQGQQFTDVKTTDAFAPAAGAAAQAGLVETPSTTLFGPNDPVSREELATALARGFEINATGTPAVSDSNQIAPASAGGVNAMVSRGFMQLNSDGSFGPRTTVSRCEAAQTLVQVLNDREARLYGGTPGGSPATPTASQPSPAPATPQPAPANSTILVPDSAYPGGLLTGVVIGPDDKPVPNTPVQIAGAVPASLGGVVIGDSTPCSAAGGPNCPQQQQPQQPQTPVAGNTPPGSVPPLSSRTPASATPTPGNPTAGSAPPVNCASILRTAGTTPSGLPTPGQLVPTPAGMVPGQVPNPTGAYVPASAQSGTTPGLPAGTTSLSQVVTDATGHFALCMAPSAPTLNVNLPGATPVSVPAVQGQPPAVTQPPDFFQGGQKITVPGSVGRPTATQNGTTWQLPVAQSWSPDGRQTVTAFRTPLQLQPGPVQLSYTGNDGRVHSSQHSVFRIIRAYMDHEQLHSNQGAKFEYDVQFSNPNGQQLCVSMRALGPIALIQPPPPVIPIDTSGLGKFTGKIRATPVPPGSTVPFDLSADVHVCSGGR